MTNLRFQISPGASGSGLTFDLLRDDERALSAGRAFDNREDCLAAIQEVVQALGEDRPPFTARAMQGGTVLELSAPEGGGVLARSEPLSAQAATALQSSLAEAALEQEEYQIEFPATMTQGALTASPFLGAAHTVSAEDYDFAWLSASGTAGFESFQSARDGKYFFHFNDAQGRALLYSRGFRTAAERNKRLQAVREGGARAQRYESREEAGSYFFLLKARNGQEIARSRAFTSPGERETALAWLTQAVAEQAEPIGKTRARRPRGKSGALLGLAALTGAAGFELLRNAADRRHYFLFNGDDGRTLLFSQGYKTSESRDQAVRTLIRLSANPARYEALRAEGEHAFVVRAGNRQEIARSRAFESETEAAAAMGLLQARLPDSAQAFGVPTETLETQAGERMTIRAERDRLPLIAAATAAGIGVLALGEAAHAEANTAPATNSADLPSDGRSKAAPVIAGAAGLGALALGEAAHAAAPEVPAAATTSVTPSAAPTTDGSAALPLAAAAGLGALALGEAAHAEVPEAPASPAPSAVPPSSSAPVARPIARRSAAGWGRLWPVPLALLALACVPWLLAHRQPHTPSAQSSVSNAVTPLSSSAVAVPGAAPVKIAVGAYIASARHGHPQTVAVQKVTAHKAQPTRSAPLVPAASDWTEVPAPSRKSRHRPNPVYLNGMGS